jgi:hypothetical protein
MYEISYNSDGIDLKLHEKSKTMWKSVITSSTVSPSEDDDDDDDDDDDNV